MKAPAHLTNELMTLRAKVQLLEANAVLYRQAAIRASHGGRPGHQAWSRYHAVEDRLDSMTARIDSLQEQIDNYDYVDA